MRRAAKRKTLYVIKNKTKREGTSLGRRLPLHPACRCCSQSVTTRDTGGTLSVSPRWAVVTYAQLSCDKGKVADERLSTNRWLQCGSLRYELTRPPNVVYTCHCTDCQRLTSSAFSIALVVAEEAFRLTGLEPRRLQRTTDSGRVAIRWVCPECGSWVCGGPMAGEPVRPGEFRSVRAGTRDDTSWLRPTVHFWTRTSWGRTTRRRPALRDAASRCIGGAVDRAVTAKAVQSGQPPCA